MKMKIAGIAVLALLGCVLTVRAVDVPNVVLLTADDNGGNVAFEADQTLEIRLPGNATTGYFWEVVEIETNLLRVAHSAMELTSREIGASGTFVLRLKWVNPGTSTLRLVYKRPWEATATDKSYSVAVVTLDKE